MRYEITGTTRLTCLLSEIFGHGCPKKGLLSQDGESAPVSFVPDTSHRMSGTS